MNKNPLYLSLLLLTSAFAAVADSASCASECSPCSQSKNFWLPRAFSSYSSRLLIQEKSLLQVESEREEWNGTFSVDTEYMSNFGQKCGTCKNLGSMPFWSGTNTLTIGRNDGKANLDAYQLGMKNIAVDSDGIGGVIQLNPRIQHVGADFLLYFTQRKNERGFYFKIDAPVGAMIINPRLTELVVAETDESLTSTAATAAGTAAAGEITYDFNAYPSPANRPTSVTQAFAGDLPTDELIGYHASTLSLLKGKIAGGCCKQTAIRLSDLSATVGYNVYGTEKSLVGIGFKATCPTGNTPTAEYMLEPIFGRAGAWGVGGEVMAHHKAWANEEKARYVDLWLQGEVLHLMPGRKPNMRSFDLKNNGAGSKYLLVQHYSTSYSGSAPITEATTPGSLQPAINLTTLPVISKISIEGSVALMADFHCHDWNFGIGGEFWGRSRECLSIDNCSPLVIATAGKINEYAVVGRQLSAYNIQGQGSLPTYYVEPAAKINESQAPVTLISNIGVVAAATTLPTGIALGTNSDNRIPADLTEALDIAGAAAAKAYTGKIFGQLGYTFSEHRYSPSVSVVGGAEFTNNNNNAVQLWSVALQGALNF